MEILLPAIVAPQNAMLPWQVLAWVGVADNVILLQLRLAI
jgi:hypothetical protein